VIQVSQRFATAIELRRGLALDKRNLADENARAGSGDAVHFPEAGRNVLAGNHQQHAVTHDDGSARVRHRQLIGESLTNVEACPAHQSDFFLGSE
jgi:hypothetical protein